MNTNELAENGMMEDSNITNKRWYQRINYIKNKFVAGSYNNNNVKDDNKNENTGNSILHNKNNENILNAIVQSVEMNATQIQTVNMSDLGNTLPNEPILIQNGMENFFNVEENNHVNNKFFTLENLIKKCGDSYFRLDDNHTGRIRLKQFYEYMKYNQDDAPLYIFDSQFAVGADENRKSLKKAYYIPELLSADDLFKIVPSKYRPPYQWILIGSSRSGTNIHQDPLGTSAWNGIIEGTKLWCFFPPDTAKDIVVNVNIKSGIYWFLNIFPQIILNDDIVGNKQKIQPYFTIQKAGDIVFVPCDWYHVVINLENTVAITHNFAMKRDVNKIIPRVFRDEPQFGLKWLNELRNNNQKDVEIFRQMEQYISEHKVDDDENECSSDDEDWSGSDESVIELK